MRMPITRHHVLAPTRGHRQGILTVRTRLLVLFSVAALMFLGTATADAHAAGLCAFHEKTTADGLVATSTFHVVRDGCTVSLVSVEHYASGAVIFDTATARNLTASETRYTLTVNLGCGRNTEADLVLGEPLLFPPAPFDLQATPFRIACAAPAPAPLATAAPVAAPAAPAPAALVVPAAAPATTPTLLPTPTPTSSAGDRAVTWTPLPSTPQTPRPTCSDKQKLVNGTCVVKAKRHTSNKPAGAKKKREGVLGVKKSKTLPFTK